MTRPPREHLRIVPKAPAKKKIAEVDVSLPHGSPTLFERGDPRLLVRLDFNGITEADFLSALAHLQPKFLIDLREAPRFDLGSMNRRLVFSLLEQWGTKYVDFSANREGRSHREATEPKRVANTLIQTVFKRANQAPGPIIFVMDEIQFTDTYFGELAKAMEPLSKSGWQLIKIPEFDRRDFVNRVQRSVIFISHATPEQNDFAAWLGTRLELAGYQVWYDVDRLKGGELFWDEIETVLRQQAGKVLVAVTHEAQQKAGVLDEVNLAINIERSVGLENFVIPLRVGPLPFDQFRANLARKNIIDFSSNWAVGLEKLLQSLERDGFPKAVQSRSQASRLLSRENGSSNSISLDPELVQLNWAEIVKLPKTIYFHSYEGVPIETMEYIVNRLGVPIHRYLRLTVGFASPTELVSATGGEYPISLRCKLSTEDFLRSGTSEMPGLKLRDTRNIVVSLLRQAWDLKAASLGLCSFLTASGSVAWYLPAGHIPADQVIFFDISGVKRRKKLVGFSKKRNVYWHFALELKPVISGLNHFSLRSHVIFSYNGRDPIASASKMHALRRGFCRSWWNEQWRNLTAAYLSFVSGEGERIVLPTSVSSSVQASAQMFEVESPVSLVELSGSFAPDDAEVEIDISDEDDQLISAELAETGADVDE